MTPEAQMLYLKKKTVDKINYQNLKFFVFQRTLPINKRGKFMKSKEILQLIPEKD